MISNWTGHVKKCFNAKSCKSVKQQTISQFLPPGNAKSVCVNKETGQNPIQRCITSGTPSDNLSASHKCAKVKQSTLMAVNLDESPNKYITHGNTQSPSFVTTVKTEREPTNYNENSAIDLTCMDENNQCFLQASPVRVNQERLQFHHPN